MATRNRSPVHADASCPMRAGPSDLSSGYAAAATHRGNIMKIVVIGGSGLIGSKVVNNLRARS
jgi:hypothetical protein